MNFTDIRIVRANAIGDRRDIGAAAAKALPPSSRYRYSQPMAYTLATGEVIEGVARGKTRAALERAIASRAAQAPAGVLFAGFRDGVFTGVALKLSLNFR